MLKLHIGELALYDEDENLFSKTKPVTVRLEHSLISISKWESIWEKPFLPSYSVKGMTGREEEISYISCMIIGEVDDYIPSLLLELYSRNIKAYIEKKHTATTTHTLGSTPPSRQTMTSELIYYWMIKFGIPMECQRWHINRLLTLIDVCSIKESAASKNGKITGKSAINYMHQLNKARRHA